MNLNFTMSELIKSDTANLYKINNMPDINSLDNILILISRVLQPVRELFGQPVLISSGYRTKLLNDRLKGSKTSEHLQGLAADFTVKGYTVAQVVEKIRKSGIVFNQLIEEYGSNGAVWVHISYNPRGNKKEVLRYKNGIYTKI